MLLLWSILALQFCDDVPATSSFSFFESTSVLTFLWFCTHALSGPRTARVTCVRDATVLICPWTLLEKVFAAHEVAAVAVAASASAALNTGTGTTDNSSSSKSAAQHGNSSGPNSSHSNSNANSNAAKPKTSEAARAFARLKNDAFERWLFSQSAVDRTEADIDRLLEHAGDAITQV